MLLKQLIWLKRFLESNFNRNFLSYTHSVVTVSILPARCQQTLMNRMSTWTKITIPKRKKNSTCWRQPSTNATHYWMSSSIYYWKVTRWASIHSEWLIFSFFMPSKMSFFLKIYVKFKIPVVVLIRINSIRWSQVVF